MKRSVVHEGGVGVRDAVVGVSPGLPAPTLRDGHLVLRPWRPRDAPALAEACGDDAICRFTTVPRAYSRDAAKAWIARQERRCRDGSAIVLAIHPAVASRPVGTIWLFSHSPGQPLRLGYWVIERERRRGLATGAVRLLAAWAFSALELDRIHIELESWNMASRRVAERASAVLELRLTRHGHTGPVAVERYALSRAMSSGAAAPALPRLLA